MYDEPVDPSQTLAEACAFEDTALPRRAAGKIAQEDEELVLRGRRRWKPVRRKIACQPVIFDPFDAKPLEDPMGIGDHRLDARQECGLIASQARTPLVSSAVLGALDKVGEDLRQW